MSEDFDFEAVEVGSGNIHDLARDEFARRETRSACCLSPIEIDGIGGTFCAQPWRGGCGKSLRPADLVSVLPASSS